MADIVISGIQQLGGWPFDPHLRAVACTIDSGNEGDTIPLASLGLRRLDSMWVYSGSVVSRTPRLLGTAYASPFDTGDEYCFTAYGSATAPTLKITSPNGTESINSGGFGVIFVGEQ